MAVFGTRTKKFLPLLNAVLDSNPGFINRVSSGPVNASAGALTARVTTAVTLQTPTDGTMLANNAARTEVNLTAFIGVHNLSLFDYELDQWDADADSKEFLAFANASRLKAELEIMTDIVGGTFSGGNTTTLSNGQLNFSTDGTDAEINDNFQKLNLVVSHLQAKTQGKATGDLTLVARPETWANLKSMVGTSHYARFLEANGNLLSYQGIPIYVFDQTLSGFSASATDATLVGFHSDAEYLSWSGVSVPFGTPRIEADGLYHKQWHAFGFAGLVQSAGHIIRVLNGAS